MTEPLRIAFPLGIGDCWWSTQKLAGLKALFPGRPIHVEVNKSEDHSTVNFLRLLPVIDRVEETKDAPYDIEKELPRFMDPRWATLEGSQGWHGYDFVMVPNGHFMSRGRIETFFPECSTDYCPEIRIPEPVERSALALCSGSPVLLYVSGTSANRGFHAGTWKLDDWAGVVRGLNEFGISPVIVGAASVSDKDYWRQLAPKLGGLRFRTLIGNTSHAQIMSIMRRASVWIGLNSGLGIVAASMGTPVVMLWSDSRFPIKGAVVPIPTEHHRCWLDPSNLASSSYRTLSFGDPALTPQAVVSTALEVRR